jgi:hypothetical protein
MRRNRQSSIVGVRRAIAGITCTALAGGLLSLAFAAQRQALAADEPPPVVRKAVADYALQTRGNLAFTRHLTFSMRVGPMNKQVTNEVGIVMRDGQYVRTKYYAATTNGQSDSDGSIRKQEQQTNDELAAGRGFFKRPVDPRYVDDYHFEETACSDCKHDTSAVRFTSLVRDNQHGDGTMTIDKAGRIYSIDYDMNVAPDHASSGHVVETYGEAMSGLWTCLRSEETYKGHLGFVGGAANLDYNYDHFKRYAQPDAAIAALEGHTY